MNAIGRLRNGIVVVMLLLTISVGTAVESAELKPVVEPDKTKSTVPMDRLPDTASPPSCQAPRERAKLLHVELEGSLSLEAKSAGKQYVAKPGPGVSTEKAWGDYAAGAALVGNTSLAAWAGLTAAELKWSGETVTNAGVYVFYLGKVQDSFQFLNCAYAMGDRSPYLLEALATVHHKLGRPAEARQAIAQAKQSAPDDPAIETTASLLTTGQPPPPAPPSVRSDSLDDAIRELEQHAARTLSLIKAQADTMDRSLPDATGLEHYGIAQTYFQNLLQNARDQARSARAMDARSRQPVINAVLGIYIDFYAQFTNQLLSFPSATETGGSPVLFWAPVLGLDAPILGRESRRGAIDWSMHTALGPALAQGAEDEYNQTKEAEGMEHHKRFYANSSREFRIREKARWCSVWKSLYERWEAGLRQRYNTAARGFDRIATRTMIQAENELLLTRDFAVRQVQKMTFQKRPGFDEKKLTLENINRSLTTMFEKHLSAKATNIGTVPYIRERASWFEGERSSVERGLDTEAKKLKDECEPALHALLELLIQEEWQAYLDHLRDRIAWDLQGQAEASEFPCEGSIGPVKIGTDLNKPGEGKMDIKWSRKDVPVSVTGTGTVGQDQTFGLGIGMSVQPSSEGGQGSDSIVVSGKHGTSSGQVLEGSGCYGPFCGKAKVSLTSKVSPWNSREFLGIKLKGTAGLGLKRGQTGVACYPSSGSVTFYPRALYEDTVRYMSTPAAPPR